MLPIVSQREGSRRWAARTPVHLALIRPPAVSSRGAYSVAAVPPLGLAYVAAALEEAGHRVTAIDALGEAPFAAHDAAHPLLVAHGLTIEEILARVPPDVEGIGISVMFSQQWPHVAAIVRALAAAFPRAPIFVGGEHATATWQHLLASCPEVTLCALGEGEETVLAVAEWVAGDAELDAIPGIAFRRAGRPHANPRRGRIAHIDRLARPAWHLFPLETYLANGFGHGVNRGRSMPMLATRGCPYSCRFCSSPEMWTTRYRMRSVEDVVDEIADYVARYRVTNIDFEDLTAFIDRKWILAFCAELERRELSITFQLPSGTRSEALDREVLAALYRSGCRNLTYAPESGSPRTLRTIKKKLRPEKVLRSMREAKRLGVNLKANLMIGFPDETRRELFETLWFGARAAWMGVDDIPLFPFSPYPGTDLYDELRADGVLPPPDDDYYARLGYMDMGLTTSVSRHVGPVELNVYRILGMSVFYALGYARHPSRVLRTLENFAKERSDTVLEQRLVELKQRWRNRRRAREAGAQAPVERDGRTTAAAPRASRVSASSAAGSP